MRPQPLRATILDRAVAHFAPRRGVERLVARRAWDQLTGTRKYDGASRGPRLRNWLPGSKGPTAEIASALPILRDRCRDLVRNDPWCARGADYMQTALVGSGIRPTIHHEKDAVLARVKEKWWEWAESTACDASPTGKGNWYSLQSRVARAVVTDGGPLVRRRWRRPVDGLPVPFQVELLEIDHLAWELERAADSGGRIVHGIELGPTNQLSGYWLHREHPGETARMRASPVRVPGRDVLQPFEPLRPEQLIGVPRLAPAIVRAHALRQYEDAELVRATVASAFAVFVTTEEGGPLGDADAVTGSDGKEELLEKIAAAGIHYMRPGESITVATPPTTSGFDSFAKAHLRAIAMAWGCAYESISGDLSMVNFSSGRMGWIAEERTLRHLRADVLIPQFCEPSWRWFVEGLVMAGDLTEREAADLWVEWTHPRREMLDPVKEALGILTMIEGGLLPWAEAQRELGKDPDDVLAEFLRWQVQLAEAGIVGGAGGASAATGTEARSKAIDRVLALLKSGALDDERRPVATA